MYARTNFRRETILILSVNTEIQSKHFARNKTKNDTYSVFFIRKYSISQFFITNTKTICKTFVLAMSESIIFSLLTNTTSPKLFYRSFSKKYSKFSHLNSYRVSDDTTTK